MSVNLSAIHMKLTDYRYIFNKKCENNNNDDELSQRLWQIFMDNRQTFTTLTKKIQLKDKIVALMKPYFEGFENLKFVNIYVSGSTANGFATNDSDIDLCFIAKNIFENHNSFDLIKSAKIVILAQIQWLLASKTANCELIEARVPILRFNDSETNIQVEININNDIGVKNTRLLYCYSKCDWRVSPICVAIKKWAKDDGIIDSYGGALSSYCIELMVIQYLQCCLPPVLPCLQKICPNLFNPYGDINTFKCLPNLSEVIREFECKPNLQPLSLLMCGFFGFYLFEFDFRANVASVRLGHPMLKCELTQQFHSSDDPNEWHYFGVEEPFNYSNVAHTLYNEFIYDKVVNWFETMHSKLKSLSLE